MHKLKKNINMKRGLFLLILGLIMLDHYFKSEEKNTLPFIFYITFIILIISGLFFIIKHSIQENEKRIINLENKKKYEETIEIIKENDKINNDKIFNERISRLDSLKLRMEELNTIQTVEISDYKTFIEENQIAILHKGNDDVLFSFLKIDSFLSEYKQGMESCKDWMLNNIDVDVLKTRFIEDSNRNDLNKLSTNLQANLNRSEGKKPTGFEANFDSIITQGHHFKVTYENYNKTLEYYKNIAKTMVLFYLSDNKISYFEIYQAFDKLGVFDSSWQKNLMSKMTNIEADLNNISYDLNRINSNFEQLINRSEKISNELHAIKSSVQTGNMIQVISAYQLWRLNIKNK